MRSSLALLFLCACGGGTQETAAEPVAPAPLPTVQASAAPPPTAPAAPTSHAVAPLAPLVAGDEPVLAVSFAEVRKHPESAELDAAVRSAPAWRAFPTIDPVRDLDWVVEQGDDMLVRHATPDAQVDAAIAAVAKPFAIGVAGVRAWRGVVNQADVVFLRAAPQIVRIAPADHAGAAASELARGGPSAPSFQPGEAARFAMRHPAGRISGLPDDVSEARFSIESRPADAGAEIWGDADCPDEASAQRDAATIADYIQQKNGIALRIVTDGLFNAVDVQPDGRHVRLHASASQRQIQAVLAAARSQLGGP